MTEVEGYNKVVGMLSSHHLHFTEDGNKHEIFGAFLPIESGVAKGRPTYFHLMFKDGYIVNYTHRDIVFSECSERALSLITLINSNVLCGNFQVDYGAKGVLYKNTMSLTALEYCTYDEFYRFVSLPTNMFIKYDDKLRLIISK